MLTVANLWMCFKDVGRVELENIRVWADLTSDLLIDSANLKSNVLMELILFKGALCSFRELILIKIERSSLTDFLNYNVCINKLNRQTFLIFHD